MITNKQRVFLQKLKDGELAKEDNPKKFSAVMIRIQKQIDKNIDNLVWLVDNYPEILKDVDMEIGDVNVERYRRFKAFGYILNRLDPQTELEEVDLPKLLVQLSRLYPEFYFRLIRKNKNVT